MAASIWLCLLSIGEYVTVSVSIGVYVAVSIWLCLLSTGVCATVSVSIGVYVAVSIWLCLLSTGVCDGMWLCVCGGVYLAMSIVYRCV